MTSTEVTAAPPGQGSRLPPTFRALRHRNYRLWFFGQGVSLIGTWMQTMAQQVLIYRLTGSAAALGVINAIGLIPLIPLSLWGGSIADRAPKRTIILIAQTVMMLQAFCWPRWPGPARFRSGRSMCWRSCWPRPRPWICRPARPSPWKWWKAKRI